jgi:hypothetical protein
MRLFLYAFKKRGWSSTLREQANCDSVGMETSSAVRWRITAGFAIALFTLPVLVDLTASEEPRVFGYVAADAFSYFTVAKNAADTGRFSFDQETLTNGFHPLWQVTLVPISVGATSCTQHFSCCRSERLLSSWPPCGWRWAELGWRHNRAPKGDDPFTRHFGVTSTAWRADSSFCSSLL